MSEPFLAEIRIVGFNFAPRGWAFCDGQLLSIAENSALFSLLGTTYGGDGRTTFGLPDLRGRVAIHEGQGPGLSARSLGSKGGAEQVTLTTAQIPNHAHALQVSPDAGDPMDPISAVLDSSITLSRGTPDAKARVLTTTGSGQAHPNMQPYTTLNAVIALQGVFPSRN